MDNHTPEQIRRNMQAIRSKDTSIELMLRRELWSRGYRYRKNCKKKLAVFCDSEFCMGMTGRIRRNGSSLTAIIGS